MGLFLLLGCAALILYSFYFDAKMSRDYPATGLFQVVGGIKIHYRDLNPNATDLPAIVLIHGSSCHGGDMAFALGDELSKTRRVIIIDRPGHGHSDPIEDSYRLDLQALTIKKLLDQLDIEKPIIAGQSYGGTVALTYALEHPQHVAGLLLMAPVSHAWPGGVSWRNHLGAMPISGWLFRRMVLPFYMHFKGQQACKSGFWPQAVPAHYFDKAAMPLIFRNSEFRSISKDITRLYDQIVRMEHRYSEIKVPVRILAGTHDTVVLATLHSQSLWNQIENAEFTLVPAAGHPLHHVAQEEILGAVAELDTFIEENDPARRKQPTLFVVQ